MKLHLINGFLGSGKTTAIITATKSLMRLGKTVGIVTNDRGQFQVDTAFFQSSRIPTQQVTGGCFRCSFSEFEEKITQLQETTSPDIIFAESVGSCVDLVNTIFPPIQQNHHLDVDISTYSVFSDIRLFKRWIHHESLPFSEKVEYLFTKQIEESKLLVLNKSDLLSADQQKDILAVTVEEFPEKIILLQNSLDQSSILPWLKALDNEEAVKNRLGFVVDYSMYKSGEKEMAWLDQKFLIESQVPEKIKPALIELINLLLVAIQREGVFVGHIKLLLSYPEEGTKLSFTSADFLEKPFAPHWIESVPDVNINSLSVMLNARVSMNADDFSEIVKNTVNQVALSPQIHIRSEEGTSYNPEMSMNRP
jgi:G3E family GTPase